MYSDKQKRHTGWIVLVLLVVLAAAGAVYAAGFQSEDIREEGALAIQDAIERTALQCYAVEGVYPPSLAYLEDHYGLQINTREYYVTYDAFASNLPPTVRVIEKPAD